MLKNGVILITGASGFLGWTLCRAAGERFDVLGVYSATSREIAGVRMERCDIADFGELKEFFARVKPSAVINAAAVGDPNFVQENREMAERVNVTAAANLAGLAADAEIPLAHVSTDLVFGGREAKPSREPQEAAFSRGGGREAKPPYREEASPAPVSFYGEQKAAAEKEVLARHENALIVRPPLMFGEAPPSSRSFFPAFLAAMRAGRELRLFTDEFRTPVGAASVSTGILQFLGNRSGLLHLGGRESVSRYELGRLMAEVYEIPSARLIPSLLEEVVMSAPRPRNVSLDSSLALSLGYNPPTLRDDLARLKGLV